MKNIPVLQENAWKAYDGADASGKALLENLLGKDNLKREITARVKTFEDACTVLNYDPQRELNDGQTPYHQAFIKLTIIAEALNEGWTPDWNNDHQYKYYPYFSMSSGFSLNRVGSYYRSSFVPSRLCFRTEALATYAATQFLDLYRDLFVIA